MGGPWALLLAACGRELAGASHSCLGISHAQRRPAVLSTLPSHAMRADPQRRDAVHQGIRLRHAQARCARCAGGCPRPRPRRARRRRCESAAVLPACHTAGAAATARWRAMLSPSPPGPQIGEAMLTAFVAPSHASCSRDELLGTLDIDLLEEVQKVRRHVSTSGCCTWHAHRAHTWGPACCVCCCLPPQLDAVRCITSVCVWC